MLGMATVLALLSINRRHFVQVMLYRDDFLALGSLR